MKPSAVFIIVIIAIVCIMPFASADYTYYMTYGNTATQHHLHGTAAQNYTRTVNTDENSGSYDEAIVYDINADGINDMFTWGTGGALNLIESDSPSYISDSKNIGAVSSQGVICDVDQDGIREYVVVTENNGTRYLNSISIAPVRKIDIEAISIVNGTTSEGITNLVCDNFYDNDNKNYVLWIDSSKQLHIVRQSGSSFVQNTIDPESASTKEATSPYTLYSSGELSVSHTFNADGHHTAIYIAGKYFIVYKGDGHSYSKDFQSYANFSGVYSQPQKSFKMVGEVPINNLYTTGVAFYTSGRSNTNNNYIVQAKEVQYCILFACTDDLSITSYSGVTLPNTIQTLTITGGNYITFIETPNGGGSNSQITKISPINMSATETYSSLLTGAGSAATFAPNYANIFSLDSIVYFQQNHNGTHNRLYTIDARNFSAGVTSYDIFLKRVSASSPSPFNIVDFDKDGLQDIIISNPSKTVFYMSQGAVTPTQTNYPFNVSVANNSGVTSRTRVDVGFNNTNYVYNYALVCDMSETTIWNEQFALAYNFTTRNVSLSVAPPEDFLTFNAVVFPINATFPQFDMVKYANTASRDNLRQRITMNRVGNNSLDYIVYAGDNQITYWLRFNKTGSNVRVDKIVDGARVNIANYTSSSQENIIVDYTPSHDGGNNIDYFTTTIKNGNTTIVSDSTYQYTGSSIQNVEFYSDTDSTTITINNIGLFKVSNAQPGFVQFQNGQRFVSEGITIMNPPPVDSIGGSGFTVYPDYNSTFYATCSYPVIGNYTQRHYIAPIDTVIDYSNYREITVSITNSTSTSDITPPGGDNVITDMFTNLFGTSPAILFFIWIAISLMMSFLCFKLLNYSPNGGIFGMLVFVVFIVMGGFFGLVPIWIIIVLAILAGLVFTSGFSRVFMGGG